MENFNGRLRQRAARFVRRGLPFSRREEFHEEAVRIFLTEHNLAILHQR